MAREQRIRNLKQLGAGRVRIAAFDAGLVLRRFPERLDFTALTMWPAGRPPSPIVRRMPPNAGKASPLQFHPIIDSGSTTLPQ